MRIKFLCLNLHQGGNFFDEILSFIKQGEFDILALQEVYDGKDENLPRNYRTLELFQKELPEFSFVHFSPAFLEVKDFGKIVQGNSIFSKFPFVSKSTIFYDVPYGERIEIPENFPTTPRNLMQTEIILNGKPIHIFNTQGIWGVDGRDSDRRFQMAYTIVQNIKDKENFILCGDFNMNPNTDAMQQIELYAKNIFKNKIQSTFNMRQKTNPAFATAIVDMIYLSPSLKEYNFTCPDVNISDHLPLLTEIEIP